MKSKDHQGEKKKGKIKKKKKKHRKQNILGLIFCRDCRDGELCHRFCGLLVDDDIFQVAILPGVLWLSRDDDLLLLGLGSLSSPASLQNETEVG